MSFLFVYLFLLSFSHPSQQTGIRAWFGVCNLVRKMSVLNIKIDKFTGRNNSGIWQIKMRALLEQQGLWGLLKAMEGEVTAEMAIQEEKVIADDVITEVSEDKTAAGLLFKSESLIWVKKVGIGDNPAHIFTNLKASDEAVGLGRPWGESGSRSG